MASSAPWHWSISPNTGRGEQNNNLYDLNIISAVIQSVYIQTSILSQTVPVAPGNTQLTSVLRDFHQNQNNNLSGDIYQPAAAIWGNVTPCNCNQCVVFLPTLNSEDIPIQTKMSRSIDCAQQEHFRPSQSVSVSAGLSSGQVRDCNYPDNQDGWSSSLQLEVFIFHHLLPPPSPLPAHSFMYVLCGGEWYALKPLTHTPVTLRKTYCANQFVSNHRNWNTERASTQHSTKYFVFQEIFSYFQRNREAVQSGACRSVIYAKISDRTETFPPQKEQSAEKWDWESFFFAEFFEISDQDVLSTTITRQDDPAAGPTGGYVGRYDWQHCQ